MNQKEKCAQVWKVFGLVAALAASSSAIAVPVVYTDETSWMNAITAINATAVFGLEDWNGEAVTGGTGLNAGPNVYGGASSLSRSTVSLAVAA